MTSATTDPRRILRQIQNDIAEIALQIDPAAQFMGRIKDPASTRHKTHVCRLRGVHVLDSIGVRIIVLERDQCYRLMLRLHRQFASLADEYDDYIASPKRNGYQSLHTILLTAQRQPVEVQVRTRAMHDRAEWGTAAHVGYKRELLKRLDWPANWQDEVG